MKKKAIILLSGGVDSTTTLAWVNVQGYECYALSIFYGQRSHAELKSASSSAQLYGAVDHRVITVPIGDWGASALTDFSIDVPHDSLEKGIPVTYVPARNTMMLSVALSWAEAISAHDIFYGANQIDYSNYPDCRSDYIAAFEKMANLATRDGVEGRSFRIHAPLLNMTKAEIIQKGVELGVDFSLTVSCYNADNDGNACGQCDSCCFRAKGFEEAHLEDVTRYAAHLSK